MNNSMLFTIFINSSCKYKKLSAKAGRNSGRRMDKYFVQGELQNVEKLPATKRISSNRQKGPVVIPDTQNSGFSELDGR